MPLLHALEKTLYGFPLPSHPRKSPMKVLALGYSRSATESLHTALLTLGYNHTYHGYDIPLVQPFDGEAWVRLMRRKWGPGDGDGADCLISAADFDVVLGHCEAVTDTPPALFAAELIRAYPDAKVILNRRADVDAWYRSFDETFCRWDGGWAGWKKWARSWFCAELYWIQKTTDHTVRLFFYGRFASTGKWVYRQHAAAIRGSVPREGLLEWSVEDGWGPLCGFLGKEVPRGEFPRGNEAGGFLGRVAGMLEAWNRRADRNMVVLAGAVMVLVGLVVVLLR